MTPAWGSHSRMHHTHLQHTPPGVILVVPFQRALAGPAAAAQDHVRGRACISWEGSCRRDIISSRVLMKPMQRLDDIPRAEPVQVHTRKRPHISCLQLR